MIDCALGALAMMAPDKVMAASDGGNTGISIGGWDADRKPFVYVDFTCGAWGARPWADGLEGNANIFSNMASQSVEITEAEHPVEILRYEFLADRAGRWPATEAARHSRGNTGSPQILRACRFAPTGQISAPMGCMAAGPVVMRGMR